MNADRFAPESHEDFLCRGKTAREAAEIRERLAREDQIAEQLAEQAMAEDPPQPEHSMSPLAADLFKLGCDMNAAIYGQLCKKP